MFPWPRGWAIKYLNWHLISKVDFESPCRIHSYPTRHLNRSQTHAVFLHAFIKWSSIADLDFVEEKNYYKDADIIIKFGSRRHGDSIAFDGPGALVDSSLLIVWFSRT